MSFGHITLKTLQLFPNEIEVYWRVDRSNGKVSFTEPYSANLVLFFLLIHQVLPSIWQRPGKGLKGQFKTNDTPPKAQAESALDALLLSMEFSAGVICIKAFFIISLKFLS